MKKLMALVVAFAVAATLEAASAQFAYQGVLKDSSGNPLTGTKQVELRLYKASTGSSGLLWGHAYSVQLDANGLFNIVVEDNAGSSLSGAPNTTLDKVFAQNNDVYISLKVGGTSGEILPRQKLLPVPFATVAANVSQASGNFSVAGKLTAKSANFSGELTASTLKVTGSSTVGALTANGGVTVTGDLSVGGKISGFGTAPIGSIIMWSGATNNIPTGWVLCDGKNGTPDLRGRFVIGAGGNYAVSAKGGAETVKLELKHIPPHTHDYKFKGADLAGAWKNNNNFYDASGHYSGNNRTKTTESAGGQSGNAVAHENMPPYWALAFIMRKN